MIQKSMIRQLYTTTLIMSKNQSQKNIQKGQATHLQFATHKKQPLAVFLLTFNSVHRFFRNCLHSQVQISASVQRVMGLSSLIKRDMTTIKMTRLNSRCQTAQYQFFNPCRISGSPFQRFAKFLQSQQCYSILIYVQALILTSDPLLLIRVQNIFLVQYGLLVAYQSISLYLNTLRSHFVA